MTGKEKSPGTSRGDHRRIAATLGAFDQDLQTNPSRNEALTRRAGVIPERILPLPQVRDVRIVR